MNISRSNVLFLSLLLPASFCLANSNNCPIQFDKLPAMGWIPSPPNENDPSMDVIRIQISVNDSYELKLPFQSKNRWQVNEQSLKNNEVIFLAKRYVEKSHLFDQEVFVLQGLREGQAAFFLDSKAPVTQIGALHLLVVVDVFSE